jgi:hypothetical protein
MPSPRAEERANRRGLQPSRQRQCVYLTVRKQSSEPGGYFKEEPETTQHSKIEDGA